MDLFPEDLLVLFADDKYCTQELRSGGFLTEFVSHTVRKRTLE